MKDLLLNKYFTTSAIWNVRTVFKFFRVPEYPTMYFRVFHSDLTTTSIESRKWFAEQSKSWYDHPLSFNVFWTLLHCTITLSSWDHWPYKDHRIMYTHYFASILQDMHGRKNRLRKWTRARTGGKLITRVGLRQFQRIARGRSLRGCIFMFRCYVIPRKGSRKRSSRVRTGPSCAYFTP